MLQELTKIVRNTIDHPHKNQVWVINTHDDTLTIQCPSPEFASVLRFSGPTICSSMQNIAGLTSITKIKLKLKKPEEDTSNLLKNIHQITYPNQNSIGCIKGLALTIANPKLQASLARLINNLTEEP